MSIDIKSLRIGSHIMLYDRRVCVLEIMGGEMIAFEDECGDWAATDLCRFEPIPITPELLAELGFEKWVYGKDYVIYSKWIDSIRLGIYINESSKPTVFEYTDNSGSNNLLGYSMPCEYLHQLEFLYYHVFHKELIEE